MSHAASEWMPFYIDDFWGSEHVAEMTDTEALLYQWCLGRQWQSGSLPADPAAIRRMVPSRFAESFETSWQKVRARFECGSDGRLRNAVCARHLGETNARIQKAAESGRRGGLERVRRLAQASLEGSLKQPLKGSSSEPQAGSDRIGSERTGEERRRKIPPAAEPVYKPVRVHHPSEAEKVWQSAWSEHRPSQDAYELTKADVLALNKINAKHGAERLREKADALLSDLDTWVYSNASPTLLVKKWSNLGGPKPVRMTPTERGLLNVMEAATNSATQEDPYLKLLPPKSK